MNLSDIIHHPRYATIVSLLLSGIIVFGVLFTTATMKNFGYPDNLEVAHWNPFSVFVRNYGFSLLLVPLAWVLAYVRSSSRHPDQRRTALAGIALIAVAIPFFAFTILLCAIFHLVTTTSN